MPVNRLRLKRYYSCTESAGYKSGCTVAYIGDKCCMPTDQKVEKLLHVMYFNKPDGLGHGIHGNMHQEKPTTSNNTGVLQRGPTARKHC